MPTKEIEKSHFIIRNTETGHEFELSDLPIELEATGILRDCFLSRLDDIEVEFEASIPPEKERIFTKASTRLDEFIMNVTVSLNKLIDDEQEDAP